MSVLFQANRTKLLLTTKMSSGADVSYLESIVRGIVSQPDDVAVLRTVDERGVLMTVKVNAADNAVVIGKSGAHVEAIRTLMRIVGSMSNSRISVRVDAPNSYQRNVDSVSAPVPSV